QAVDGIRDFHVTGVQTCALPISTGFDQVFPSSFETIHKECPLRWFSRMRHISCLPLGDLKTAGSHGDLPSYSATIVDSPQVTPPSVEIACQILSGERSLSSWPRW